MGMPHQQNQYLLAFFAAFLTGIFSLSGGYFINKYQSQHKIQIKENEYRVQAYRFFLEKIDRERSPLISQFLNLGSMADTVITDSEIQSLEDRIEKLLVNIDPQEAYWQLNSDFNILRLYGNKKTEQYCSDILGLISFNNYKINWNNYSELTRNYYKKWRIAQDDGIAYGWKEKIAEEERLMVIMSSRLFQELINHLRKSIIEKKDIT